jgi:hypothetical protein
MKRLILILLVALLATRIWASDEAVYANPETGNIDVQLEDSEFVTDEELRDWWMSLNSDQRMSMLRYIERTQNAPLQLITPNMITVQTDDGVITTYFDSKLGIVVGEGALSYDIELPSSTVQGNKKSQNGVWWFLGGLAAGALVTGLTVGLVN